MRNKRPFQFKQFAVAHDQCAMKVGTDGVLLGAWVPCKESNRVLDVGAGSGLISLMIAQRNPMAQIQAVEIDEPSFRQMENNFESSPWTERLQAIHSDFGSFKGGPYDLIVSNPPFFDSGLRQVESSREAARHSTSLPLNMLLQRSYELLSDSGCLAIIIPSDQKEACLKLWVALGGGGRCVTDVKPTVSKAAHRSMVLMSKKSVGRLEIDEMAIELAERHQYSARYSALTSPFYLDL